MCLAETTKIEIKIDEIKIKYFWMPRDCLAYVFPRETLGTTIILSCPIFYASASFSFISQSTINHKRSRGQTSFLSQSNHS